MERKIRGKNVFELLLDGTYVCGMGIGETVDYSERWKLVIHKKERKVGMEKSAEREHRKMIKGREKVLN